jgi:hypothetical protein
VFGHERENAARDQQLPGQHLDIQVPAVRILTALHDTSPKSPVTKIQQARQHPADYSANS